MYIRELTYLSPEDKLDLICKLAESMKDNYPNAPKVDKSQIYAGFSGEWPETGTEANESLDDNEEI